MSSPASRGVPRIPIAVVSGLAVGVLCGILVLRAGSGARAESGADEVDSEPASLAQAGSSGVADASAPAGGPIDEPAAGEPPIDAGVPADAEWPDAAAPEGEPDAGPDLSRRTVTLRFAILPEDASGVEIRVDGELVSGTAHPVVVEGRSRRVRVAVRARGFLTWTRNVTVGRDRVLRVELERWVPTEDDGPGGLIDL